MTDTKHNPDCAEPRITHVAILYKDVLYSLPQPNRHSDVIRLIAEQTDDWGIHGTQGFINPENGQFMNRTAAAYRAKRWGQIEETKWGKKLYSEDLW